MSTDSEIRPRSGTNQTSMQMPVKDATIPRSNSVHDLLENHVQETKRKSLGITIVLLHLYDIPYSFY